MPRFADRTKDTTTSIGTGAIVLSGVPPVGYKSFATAFSGATVNTSYCIVAGAEWEVGKGTFDGVTGLTRDKVHSSSNANALVNFSAGTKEVFITTSAEHAENANLGNIYGMVRGFMLP